MMELAQLEKWNGNKHKRCWKHYLEHEHNVQNVGETDMDWERERKKIATNGGKCREKEMQIVEWHITT